MSYLHLAVAWAVASGALAQDAAPQDTAANAALPRGYTIPVNARP